MSYADYFLNSSANVVQLELLEVSHPNFTKVYRIVRNAVNGITVTLETAEVATFDYYPAKITSNGSRDNLDQGYTIALGDLGEVLPAELDAVSAADGFATKPSLIYRSYRSDDLSAPMVGPIAFEVSDLSFNSEGASINAKAPSLNLNRTGEVYTLERFPMMKGFL